MSYKNKTIYIIWCLSAIIFAILLSLVLNNKTIKLDESIADFFYRIRGEQKGVIYYISRVVTEFGFIAIFIIIGISFVIFKLDLRSYSMGFGALFVFSINSFLKRVTDRPRPNSNMQWMYEKSSSFPSGHTINSVFLYGFLMYLVLESKLSKNIKIICSIVLCTIVLLVGLSRMTLGVHYFTDVIGALFLGILLLFVVISNYKYLKKKEFNFSNKLFIKNE